MAPTLYDEEKPEPGDLLEIFRGTYQHWAVYIGDGYVVHLAPPSGASGSGASGAGANSIMCTIYEKAMVKMEELWDVVGTDRWQINNQLDKEYEPRPADVIVTEARELVGTELTYSISSKNCEHFATEQRYGKSVSQQVHKTVTLAVVAGTFLMAATSTISPLGLVAVVAYLFGGRKVKRSTHCVEL